MGIKKIVFAIFWNSEQWSRRDEGGDASFSLIDVVVCSPARTSRDLAQLSFTVRHLDTPKVTSR